MQKIADESLLRYIKIKMKIKRKIVYSALVDISAADVTSRQELWHPATRLGH